MTEIELQTYLTMNFPKENASCEWKEFKNLTHVVSGRSGEDVISYCSALANMEGGHIVMGVEDSTLQIVGIQNVHDYTKENLPFRILGNCTNLNSEGLEVVEYVTSDTEKVVWVLHIPKHLARKPVIAHKKSWQRHGDSLVEMTAEREASILSESLSVMDDWSMGLCDGATLDNLSDEAIAKAREAYGKKNPHLQEDMVTWDDGTFLNKAKVTIDGKITKTAILLLGKAESEHFLSPAVAKISWILKDRDNLEKDYEHFSCPFLLNVDNVYAKIRNLKYRYITQSSLFPEEVDSYDPYLIREALNNCIAHQDYTLGGKINVVENEENTLVFVNSGAFIPKSIKNVITADAPESQYRNRFLANAMVNLNMIDTIGSGIKRMFTIQKKKFFPLPEYSLENNQVKVVIEGKVLDMNYALKLIQMPELTLEEIILLDKVQKGKILDDKELKQLKRKKLVEGKRPHLHISSNVANQTGQQNEYMKMRGIEDKYCQTMILDYLKQFKSAKRIDFEKVLLDKLPDILDEDQKKNKVKNNLQSLRKDGSIVNKKGIWSLSKLV